MTASPSRLELPANALRFLIMKYRTHAVDAGVSLADYEFECATDEEAKERAGRYLDVHPVLEIWQGVRPVARLSRSHAGGREVTCS